MPPVDNRPGNDGRWEFFGDQSGLIFGASPPCGHPGQGILEACALASCRSWRWGFLPRRLCIGAALCGGLSTGCQAAGCARYACAWLGNLSLAGRWFFLCASCPRRREARSGARERVRLLRSGTIGPEHRWSAAAACQANALHRAPGLAITGDHPGWDRSRRCCERFRDHVQRNRHSSRSFAAHNEQPAGRRVRRLASPQRHRT